MRFLWFIFTFSLSLNCWFVSTVLAQKASAKIDSLLSQGDLLLVKGKVDENITHYSKTLQLSEKAKYSKGIAMSSFRLAVAHLTFKEYQKALKYLERVEKEAYTDTAYHIKAELNRYYGNIYFSYGLDQEAIMSYKAAAKFGNLANPKRRFIVSMALSRVGKVYEKFKNIDSALYYYRYAYDNQLRGGDPDAKEKILLAVASADIALVYRKKNMLDSARKYIQESTIWFMETGQTLSLAVQNRQHGLVAFINGDLRKALMHFESFYEGMVELRDLDGQKEVIGYIEEIYTLLDDADKKSYFKEKYAILSDSIAILHKEGMDVVVLKMLKDKSASTKIRNSYSYYYLALAICLMSVLMFWAFRKRLFKGEGKKVMLEESPILLTESDEVMSDELLIELFRKNEVTAFVEFKSAHHQFIQKLLDINPSFTVAELKLCALMRLNFETKEIVSLMGYSLRAVESKRYRIRKKVNIPSDMSLKEWMISL